MLYGVSDVFRPAKGIVLSAKQQLFNRVYFQNSQRVISNSYNLLLGDHAQSDKVNL